MDEAAVAADATASGTFDHSNWDGVLSAHVKPAGTYDVDGVRTSTVDYRAIARDARFDEYLREIADATSRRRSPRSSSRRRSTPTTPSASPWSSPNTGCTRMRRIPSRPSPTSRGGRQERVGPPGGSLLRAQDLARRARAQAAPRRVGRARHPLLHRMRVSVLPRPPRPRVRSERPRGADGGAGGELLRQRDQGPLVGRATATLSLSKILFWFADDFGGAAAAAELAVDALPDAAPPQRRDRARTVVAGGASRTRTTIGRSTR